MSDTTGCLKNILNKEYIQNICWKNNKINTGSDLTDRRKIVYIKELQELINRQQTLL
jgi:hypothetical protein